MSVFFCNAEIKIENRCILDITGMPKNIPILRIVLAAE